MDDCLAVLCCFMAFGGFILPAELLSSMALKNFAQITANFGKQKFRYDAQHCSISPY